ncbi:MAG: AMP-binding protein, partial [bacterium]|nr:AMP-binding protein [bacterium]
MPPLGKPPLGKPGLGRLRLILSGGEALSWNDVDQLLPRATVINGYGPTEATVCALSYQLRRPPAGSDAPIPLGRPLANYEVLICDRSGRALGIGSPGEICIAGPGLARGYLGRPTRTAESFVPHPNARGERLYRTGDLGRRLADGNLLFLGRIDRQVKLRGLRIEPGEIEAVLAAHPAVREVTVVVREEPPGQRRLVAWVVPAGPATSPEALRGPASERLPDYMVPAVFAVIESLPLLPSGKVDRVALSRRPLPVPETGDAPAGYAAPRDPAEELLAGIWAAVLGLPTVGVHDNFFAIGGHSLMATQVVSRVREAFRVELPLQSLFEAPTVAELAASIRAFRDQDEAVETPPILPVPRDRDQEDLTLPLSFAQERLWFLDQFEPGSPALNIPASVRLTGTLDVPVLLGSLRDVVRRHEVLRTTFHAGDGPIQVISTRYDVAIPVVDLRSLSAVVRETESRRLAAAEALRPFDISRGPLLRLSLVRLADAEHVMLFTIHHIVADGWSMGVLIRELAALYGALADSGTGTGVKLPIQYVDFAHWQREWLRGDVLEAQLGYWRERLAGDPPLLELPADRSRPMVQTYRGERLTRTLPPELSEALRELSRRRGATLFMTLLAAFNVLLYRHSGQDDLAVGTPIAGRTRAEVEGLIGCFLNTLVLRTDLAGNPSFDELLGRVREVTLGAYAHQDVPFEKLLEELQPDRDLSRTPLFQVFFNMLN